MKLNNVKRVIKLCIRAKINETNFGGGGAHTVTFHGIDC